MNPEDIYTIPLAGWINSAVNWAALHLQLLFTIIEWPIENILHGINMLLQAAPFWLFIALIFIVGWRAAGKGVGLFSAMAFLLIGFLGVWSEAMTTLALILTAVVFCVVIGVPLGILSSRSDRFWSVLRPILDIMQTTPAFVYLVPVVMFFGVGTVPGAIAVVVVALPPLTRFTNLGIRMVEQEKVEAGLSFGASPWQLLRKVQIPIAMPNIMGGLNQTVLLAMVMSVIISLIGAKGLGLVVLHGLSRLNVGAAAVGGVAIILMAMALDRITQGVGENKRSRNGGSLWGLLRRLFKASIGRTAIQSRG